MFAPEPYRDKGEVVALGGARSDRPFRARLEAERALDADCLAAIEHDVEAEVRAAIEFAEAGSWEPVEELTRFVTSDTATVDPG